MEAASVFGISEGTKIVHVQATRSSLHPLANRFDFEHQYELHSIPKRHSLFTRYFARTLQHSGEIWQIFAVSEKYHNANRFIFSDSEEIRRDLRLITDDLRNKYNECELTHADDFYFDLEMERISVDPPTQLLIQTEPFERVAVQTLTLEAAIESAPLLSTVENNPFADKEEVELAREAVSSIRQADAVIKISYTFKEGWSSFLARLQEETQANEFTETTSHSRESDLDSL